VTAELPTLASDPNERRIVMFNTGLHDILRLCSAEAEFSKDRKDYLSAKEQQQSCTALYRQAVRLLANVVDQFPAELKIFQTSTAGWPKYGNYGLAWDPGRGQGLPMDPSFVQFFNQIAMETLGEEQFRNSNIRILDGYWITLARPDNRETSSRADTGKKLAHSGFEVVDAMVQVWSTLLIQTVCQQEH